MKLTGELGRKFGRDHRFAVDTPAEAVRALCANYPGFRRELVDSGDRGVTYLVLADRRQVTAEELHHPPGPGTIRIVPMVAGAAKGGIFETVLGVVLIVAAIALSPFTMGASAVLAASTAAQIGAIGVALALGGISTLLAPHPQTPGKAATNYDIGGNVNTAAQGKPVPIGYGEMFCGSVVISADLTVDQVPTTQTGITGLSAIVQATVAADQSVTYEAYIQWDAAGGATGYDVSVQGPNFGPTSAPRTTATSVYVTVNGQGPFECTVNPVESSGSYGAGGSVQSVYVGTA